MKCCKRGIHLSNFLRFEKDGRCFVQPVAIMSSPPAVRPILERLAYFIYLGLLACSIGMTWLGWMIGCITKDYSIMFWSLAGLVVSRLLHVHGHAHWHFHECQAALDSVQAESSGWPRPQREEELFGEIDRLFTRMDTEQDVWTRGELRREIATRLAAAPTLRQEFAERLAKHPEL